MKYFLQFSGNFNNILQAAFGTKDFYVLTVLVYNFLAKEN